MPPRLAPPDEGLPPGKTDERKLTIGGFATGIPLPCAFCPPECLWSSGLCLVVEFKSPCWDCLIPPRRVFLRNEFGEYGAGAGLRFDGAGLYGLFPVRNLDALFGPSGAVGLGRGS